MTGYTVPLLDFRTALQSVKPFADPKDDDVAFVRLHPLDDLYVSATDKYAAALAVVPIEIRETDDADPITIAVGDVDKILAVFKMPADKDMWGNAAVRISPAHGDEVTIVDASGLFDGQSLTLPAYSTEMTDLRRLVNGNLRAAPYREGGDWALSQRAHQQFTTATKVYGQAGWVHLRQHGTRDPGWVTTIGDQFIAVATAIRPERQDSTGARSAVERARDKWRDRLAGTGVPTALGDVTVDGTTVTITSQSASKAAELLKRASGVLGGDMPEGHAADVVYGHFGDRTLPLTADTPDDDTEGDE